MRIALTATVIMGLLMGLHPTAYAQAAPPRSRPAEFGPTILLSSAAGRLTAQTDPNVVTFGTLGASDLTLRGPFDSTRLSFNVPATWRLTDGGQVQLELAAFVGGVGAAFGTPPPTRRFGGSVEVIFNDVLLTTVLLDDVGERSISIPIPAAALIPTREDGRHSLTLSLDSALDCDFDQQTVLVVRSASRFVLPHETVAPSTDLTRLPRPIYQDTFVPDAATIVVPTQPTVAEVQAALTVAAGFGRASRNALLLNLVPVEQLTTTERDANHLIFVGKAAGFPMLEGLPLPAPSSGGSFNAVGASPDDGILQMTASPWSASKAVLVVGGNTDAAVVKAAQAVSSSPIRVGAQSNVALVAAVNPSTQSGGIVIDRTLADLGHADTVVSSLGFNVIEYRFDVPSDQAVGGGAYFDLAYAHSKLLQYDRSGIVVTLNNQPVGSVRFSDETADGSRARLVLPSSLIQTGTNRLQVRADLVPHTVCIDPRLARLWLRVDSTSLLHLPLDPIVTRSAPALDLSKYPQPFSLGSLLSTTAFVVPSNDPAAWKVAAQVAADLGDRSGAPLINIAAAFADAVPEDVRQTRDLLILGRPSALPIIAELSGALPAPFESGSDLALERNLQVSFRLLPGAAVGYLELLNAPWNNQRAVLAVLGTNEKGLQWAVNALTISRLRSQLAGNVAVINGEQIFTNDTRTAANPQIALATSSPGGVIEVPLSGPPAVVERPLWVLPVLGITVLLMIALVVGVVVASARRRSKS